MSKKPVGIGPRYIEITIDAEGHTEIEAHGFADGRCLKATESLEQALGVAAPRKMKPVKPVKQTIR